MESSLKNTVEIISNLWLPVLTIAIFPFLWRVALSCSSRHVSPKVSQE